MGEWASARRPQSHRRAGAWSLRLGFRRGQCRWDRSRTPRKEQTPTTQKESPDASLGGSLARQMRRSHADSVTNRPAKCAEKGLETVRDKPEASLARCVHVARIPLTLAPPLVSKRPRSLRSQAYVQGTRPRKNGPPHIRIGLPPRSNPLIRQIRPHCTPRKRGSGTPTPSPGSPSRRTHGDLGPLSKTRVGAAGCEVADFG